MAARPRRLRSGAFPDPTGMTSRTRSVGRLSGGGTPARVPAKPMTAGPTRQPTTRSAPTPTSPLRSTTPRPPTGARTLRRQGGGTRAVTTWRSLSQQRRNQLKAKARAGGPSLIRRVRRIQQARRRR